MTSKAELRPLVETAALSAFAAEGATMSAAAIVKAFSGQGVNDRTIFRWIRAVCSQPKKAVGRLLPKDEKPVPKPSAAEKTATSKAPVIAEVQMPSATAPMSSVMDDLGRSIFAANQMMIHARNADGSVKNTKLLGQGSELLRRCVETKQRMLERVFEIRRIEAYQKAMIEEARQESEDCARRILERWLTVTQEWGAV